MATSADAATAMSTSTSSDMSVGTGTGTSAGVSAGMQTSLTRGHNMSVQTDAFKTGVDAETLVDEFFTDDSEQKVGPCYCSVFACSHLWFYLNYQNAVRFQNAVPF